MVNKDDSKKSNLSKTAQEVNPHLKRTYEEMRNEKVKEGPKLLTKIYDEEEQKALKKKEELKKDREENLINIANKITDPEIKTEDNDKVDFRIHLAEAKSRVMTDDGLDDRGKTIRNNFVRKLEKKTLDSAT
jgi:hypothetical protein